jgi:hypothetical protein
VQRLFSSFPGGAAGIGLLLLRTTLGCSLVAEGVQALRHGTGASGAGALACVLVLDGVALVVGGLTPIAAVPATIAVLGRVLAAQPGSAWALVVAVAIGLLGPGAYSVDARLFGRREIEVPRHVRTDP